MQRIAPLLALLLGLGCTAQPRAEAQAQPEVQPEEFGPPPVVTVEYDHDAAVAALITTDGGGLEVVDGMGNRLVLDVPAGSLEEDRAILLTPVERIDGLPYAGGLAGAVRIEPADLRFWIPATISFELAQPVPAAGVLGFRVGPPPVLAQNGGEAGELSAYPCASVVTESLEQTLQISSVLTSAETLGIAVVTTEEGELQVLNVPEDPCAKAWHLLSIFAYLGSQTTPFSPTAVAEATKAMRDFYDDHVVPALKSPMTSKEAFDEAGRLYLCFLSLLQVGAKVNTDFEAEVEAAAKLFADAAAARLAVLYPLCTANFAAASFEIQAIMNLVAQGVVRSDLNPEVDFDVIVQNFEACILAIFEKCIGDYEGTGEGIEFLTGGFTHVALDRRPGLFDCPPDHVPTLPFPRIRLTVVGSVAETFIGLPDRALGIDICISLTDGKFAANKIATNNNDHIFGIDGVLDFDTCTITGAWSLTEPVEGLFLTGTYTLTKADGP